MLEYKYDDLINPTLQALKDLGGSATISEMIEKVIVNLNLSEEEINDIHRGNRTKLSYRLAWARTYLKNAGIIENSSRGVWALTSKGEEWSKVDKEEVKRVARLIMNKRNSNKENAKEINFEKSVDEVNEEMNEINWEDKILELIKGIGPGQFEKLCQRLLRELGFINVQVLGKSHDGGIDGVGILKISGVISFHTAFQAKRYRDTVGSSVIRDFRGAMIGRADKGLVITTGTFTREAVKEATRDGATPIDLIDGSELAEKLKDLKIGVDVKMVERVTIKEDWYRNL